ncbi:MAG: hypothetical protein FWG20_00600 [Candidatus Cloacimonetes bacterium]|nr:hypothetical protein [Candidatus Cloacimonadota bacterium]
MSVSAIFLIAATPDQDYIINSNPIQISIELGMTKDSVIRVMKNSVTKRQMIVISGETRYVIPTAWAKEIEVSLI